MTQTYLEPLSTNALTQLGVPDDWAFGVADRVRFSELDALNHVNHTTYLRWFESLRIAYMKAYQVSDMSPNAPRVVLKSVAAEYRAAMFLDEEYVVVGRTAAFRNSSFTMEYAVFSGGLRVEGSAVVVLLTQDESSKAQLNETARAAMIARDGARDDR